MYILCCMLNLWCCIKKKSFLECITTISLLVISNGLIALFNAIFGGTVIAIPMQLCCIIIYTALTD